MAFLGKSISRLASATRCLALGALLLAIGFAPACRADDDARSKAGLKVWRTAGCPDCHGSFANGEKERGEAPTGANLRQTKLDDAEIKQTIRCGRPGLGMPSFGVGAYSSESCYELPPGPAPDNLYPAPSKLKADEVDAVIVYLRAHVIGHRTITPADCAYYYGDDADDYCDPPAK